MDHDGRRRGDGSAASGRFGLPWPAERPGPFGEGGRADAEAAVGPLEDARFGAGHPVVAGALVLALGLAALLNGLAARDPAVVVVSAMLVALVLGIGAGKLRHQLGRPARLSHPSRHSDVRGTFADVDYHDRAN